MNVTDIRTDGRTERQHTTAYAALMHSIARQLYINYKEMYAHSLIRPNRVN